MRTTDRIDFDFLARSKAFAEFSTIVNTIAGMNIALYPPDDTSSVVQVSTIDTNPLCTLLSTSAKGRVRCAGSEKERFERVVNSKTYTRCLCHAGFLEIAVPVMHQGEIIAIISSGQLLPEPPSEVGFRAFFAKNGDIVPDGEAFRAAYFDALYVEPEKVDAIVKLMVFFAEHLCTTGQRLADFASGDDRRFICMMEEYIGVNLCGDISLLAAAEQTGYSQWHFSKKFHRLFGMTFSCYVQKMRIEAAERLLLRPGAKAADAAFASGFNSISQFNRVFRSVEGCTPSKWRQRRG